MTFNYMKNIYKNYKKYLNFINTFREKAEKLCFLINIKANYNRDMKETKEWNKNIN